MMEYIQQLLNSKVDTAYADFQRKLIPNIPPESVMGVRTPELRKLAKQVRKEQKSCEEFLAELPHAYFDENQLHAFIISEIKSFDECVQALEKFLPYVDNWATCDQLSPKVFKKQRELLLPYIDEWLESEKTYTVRFGIGMLMSLFLDEEFDIAYLDKVADIKSEEYYVNMMIAWYMATALAKQWDATIDTLTGRILSPWVHNKTIQKARESNRITSEQKEYLKTLKI